MPTALSPPHPASSSERHVGIDFGTTNSVVAVAGDDTDAAQVAHHGAQRLDTFRSLLCLWPDEDAAPGTIRAAAGPDAIEAFRTYGPESRLIQSVKSFVASTSFERTVIFGQNYSIVDLITLLLRGLRSSAEADLGPLGRRARCGRPVTFVGAHADETLALDRMTQAYRRIGFDDVVFVAEPEAAAHHYARTIRQPEVCLVADFGGGTSDFTLLRIEPAAAAPKVAVLGRSGVGIAGDAFDERIVQHVVAPALGLGTTYRSMSGQPLPVPAHYYESLAQWHRLSMMRTRQTLRELQDIRLSAEAPDRLERFMYLLNNELGFELHDAVTSAKARLSMQDSTEFVFRAGPIDLATHIARSDFEAWIEPELQRLAQTVDAMFDAAGTAHSAVDRVFLTGGSSLIPAVRQLFAARFGADHLSGGDEFFSIAAGLALAGRERGGG